MKRTVLSKPRKTVRPVLQPGAGRWLLVFCEHGHLQVQIPYGDWSDARRKYGRKNATVDCIQCGREARHD